VRAIYALETIADALSVSDLADDRNRQPVMRSRSAVNWW